MSAVRDVPEQTSHRKSAAIGFGVTLASIAALAGAQFLLAPHTVAVVGRMDPEIDAWAVTQLRGQLTEFYAIVALILAAYWLLNAVLGRSHLLRVRSANVALVLSGLAFALAMAVASFVQVPEAFKGICPFLGVADAFSPLPAGGFGDRQTPCEELLRLTVPSIMVGVPLTLLIVSAILRIVGSRRQ